MKTYRPFAPDQPYLLPPSPREWLPAGHLAYFVLDLVRDLDLSHIERPVQAKDARGERPYSPTMMVSLLLYAYATGVFSSRRIERATVEDVAFRFLSAGEHPHFTTINGFRGAHRAALADLFAQVLQACMSAGLVKLGHVAIDGTKMKANASKHKAMSFERMTKDDVRIRAEVETLLRQAEEVDAAEDAAEGVYDPQEEIRLREERLKKMAEVREALRRETAAKRAARLEEQALELRRKAADPSTSPRDQKGFVTRAVNSERQAQLLKPESDSDDDSDDDLPRNTPPSTPDGEPKPKAQRNFTDPQSRIMFRDGAFLQAYNAQIAVDEAHQIIVAAALSNQGPDTEYFEPMIRRVVENCQAVPARVTADAGYFSPANVRVAESLGTEPFIAVGGQRRDGLPNEEAIPISGRSAAAQAMTTLLHTPRGHAAYARRKATVEPVFGQIRSCRGYRQMSFRGLFKSRCEWLLVCATHNLLKLWRAVTRRSLALAA
ncbi:MAG TPA: IS1182 family transposase [Casimicrobiaceae bacterium]|nr:IS1182 family transposase [Steroidobacteraceae bacterium]HEV8553553.1 IS1182 family transposase [Casimicrobiaceae bacterium]